MKKDHTHLKRFVKNKIDRWFTIGYIIGAIAGLIAYFLFIDK